MTNGKYETITWNKPKLVIQRLGPLKDTNLEISNLTLLTGPPAQGKTLILNALFSDLLPADPNSVTACLFRSTSYSSSTLQVAEALVKERIIEVILRDLRLENNMLYIGEFSICIDINRGKEKIDRCLLDWIIPSDSEFSLNLPKVKRKLSDVISESIRTILINAGIKEDKGERFCFGKENVLVDVSGLAPSDYNGIMKIVDIFETEENDALTGYFSWILASLLLSKHKEGIIKSNQIKEIYDIVMKISNEGRMIYEYYSMYRPVYIWMGRGLITYTVTEPVIGDLARGLSISGMGLSAFLPATNLIQSIYEGLRILGTPEAPKELGALFKLAEPLLIYKLTKGKDRLYLDIGGKAIPFRLAHGSAVSVTGLILASAPLIRRKSGYLLIDEVEHLLHPSGQAIIALILLALSGLGIKVIATTHSPIVVTIVSKIMSAENREEAILFARNLYKELGYKPPGRDVLELIAEGVEKEKPTIYIVENGGIKVAEDPLNWMEHLSEAWLRIANWASSDTEDLENYG